MGSRKEEERHEKIIRGLMKLPPNRRCINCNSLGPQYVCTNFWTFVCMTCSGIHREFTHRVKSVSMSKFTSQEVEALQNGGNQRAREIYLKDWDSQRQRLPDNSNVDKVREFIKSVYVDKKYAGGKTADKPPRDLQRLRSHEDETRRASSYHSYSQSPPYDFQYEDRRYGKQGATLTRKPGSDRGIYVGQMSSFICSPNRLSERALEDRFANERSFSRVSDYSVSSGGDPVRSGTESPNFQKDIGFSSPPIQPSRDILGENIQHQTMNVFSDPNRIPRPQRTASLGSMGSFDSNSMSLKSYNSSRLVDVQEPEEAAGTHFNHISSSPPSSASVNHGGLDLFKAPGITESNSSVASAIDLFQLPASSASPSADMFQSSPLNPASSTSLSQRSQTSFSPSVDLFGDIALQKSDSTLNKELSESSFPKNEGWATFDVPQPTPSVTKTENLTSSVLPSNIGSSTNFDQVSSLHMSMQWPPIQSSSAQGSSSIPFQWHDDMHNVEATNETSAQTWNAFGGSITHLPVEGINQNAEPQVPSYNFLPTADQNLAFTVLEDSNKDGVERAPSYGGFSILNGPSDCVMGTSFVPSVHPLAEEAQSLAINHRSTNPFDFPDDSNLEESDRFLDMSSLQAALPNGHMASSLLGDATQSWFSHDSMTTYIPATPQGGLAYMAGQVPSQQLPNVQTQGPVASVGGNPFA